VTSHLDAERLLELIGESTGRHTRVRDASVLYAAAARPESTILKVPTFETTAERAAAILHSVIRWEPLDMWNMSFGWCAAEKLAKANGSDLVIPAFDRMALADEVLSRRVDTVAEISERIAPFLRDK